MRVFFDTNVVVEFLANRPNAGAVARTIEYCDSHGVVAGCDYLLMFNIRDFSRIEPYNVSVTTPMSFVESVS